MTEFDSAAVKSAALDDRSVRALTEKMSVCSGVGQARDAPEMYLVTTESGSEYLVDAHEGRCTCPDSQHRDVRCKHQRRVVFATGEQGLPAWIDSDAIDSQLGEHVDGTPRVTATDGGQMIATDNNIETLEEDSDLERPDDCQCWDSDNDLPCWPCFREGFESPSPAAEDDN